MNFQYTYNPNIAPEPIEMTDTPVTYDMGIKEKKSKCFRPQWAVGFDHAIGVESISNFSKVFVSKMAGIARYATRLRYTNCHARVHADWPAENVFSRGKHSRRPFSANA